MASRGYTVPEWPRQYGGGGLTPEEADVLNTEMRRLGCRQVLQSFGVSMLGPVLLEYGTEEQKMEHLPKIARGEIRWCQGYSEPGAGSDLASLATKCEDKGDHWLVNGQKIWTSYADQADWIFALVRTGPIEPKHQGISFLLMDMKSEGVSTRPIHMISGYSPFCETFFDDVKAPKDNLLGDIGQGWTIAKRLLQFERNMISGMGRSDMGPKVIDFATRYGASQDPTLRQDLVNHLMRGEAFANTLKRAREERQGASALSSMFKYVGTELNKDKYELLIRIMGIRALAWDGESFTDDEKQLTRAWLRTKANSIEGGTSEVQLNVIAKRVLQLPTS